MKNHNRSSTHMTPEQAWILVVMVLLVIVFTTVGIGLILWQCRRLQSLMVDRRQGRMSYRRSRKRREQQQRQRGRGAGNERQILLETLQDDQQELSSSMQQQRSSMRNGTLELQAQIQSLSQFQHSVAQQLMELQTLIRLQQQQQQQQELPVGEAEAVVAEERVSNRNDGINHPKSTSEEASSGNCSRQRKASRTSSTSTKTSAYATTALHGEGDYDHQAENKKDQ